jgi:DNA-binding response OmpR family regulator/anti-sigma regulatory factor (Ser/Thr protein kinase)
MKSHDETKILVIEDENIIRNSIVELLELRGYLVSSTDDSKKSIQLAVMENPDLILSDVMMPGLSGYEVLEILRSMPETLTTPFIFLTAKAERTDVRHGMGLGADDYLAKPFTKKELYSAIDSQLNKRHNLKLIHDESIRELKLTLSVSLPHELRTPLNGIYSSSQFLIANSDSLDKEDQLELYEAISKSSVRLNRLIQNYLLYTELELYDENIRRKPDVSLKNCSLDPDDVIESALIHMREFEGFNEDIDLIKNHEGFFAILIRPNHLQKIIEELVSNAFKFQTEKDRQIQIASNIDITQKTYTFEVTNYGLSLSKHDIDSISSYVQFKREKNEQQGLGLGLFIVKSLAELYDGRFIVDSKEGEGNRFTVMLPLITEIE